MWQKGFLALPEVDFDEHISSEIFLFGHLTKTVPMAHEWPLRKS